MYEFDNGSAMKLKVFLSELRLYVCNHIVNKIPSHVFRLMFYRKIMRFKIDKNVSIGLGCIFDATDNLSIGFNSVINARCRLDTRGGIRIAENVSISCDTIILTADHDPNEFMAGRNQPVKIDSYVFVGTRSMILAGVDIGTHTVIAAGSVVSKNIPSRVIAGGVPAKIIKEVPNDGILMREFNSYYRLFQ
ncbi:acyltransferase [Acinetobacter soli]|uniref:acyltransferase n=2 Tax=Acinetobacter soli TaxID=487316 RepID=UPI0032187C77